MKVEAEIIRDLLKRVAHLEDNIGPCDCFECFTTKEKDAQLTKKARAYVRVAKKDAKHEKMVRKAVAYAQSAQL